MADVEEAKATMTRVRDEAINQLADGNQSYAAQLEEAHKALKILAEVQTEG